jgi:hypothetical protein
VQRVVVAAAAAAAVEDEVSAGVVDEDKAKAG